MEMATDDRVLEALKQALNLLDDGKHWTKRSMKHISANFWVSYCTLGAIQQACFNDGLYILARDTFSEANQLQVFAPYSQIDVASWNDDPRTLWCDVELAFKKAIAHQEEKVYSNDNR